MRLRVAAFDGTLEHGSRCSNIALTEKRSGTRDQASHFSDPLGADSVGNLILP